MIKIKFNYLAASFFFLAPSFSLQQNTMEIYLRNQERININNKQCRVGYLENSIYATCDGSRVNDGFLLNELISDYKLANEIKKLNSNILTNQVSSLENLIDRSILREIGGMISRMVNSFDDKFWWTGTVNATTEMYVDPKFYARTFIGNAGREAILHQKNAIQLIRMAEQHTILNDMQYDRLYKELSMSYPYVEPLIEFSVAVNHTSNPLFEINKKELEEFKKIRFDDKNSPEVKAIRDRIINRIRNTPEFKRYDSEVNRRINYIQNLRNQ